MQRMVNIDFLPNLHNEFHVCENYLLGKMTRASFGKGKTIESLLEVVHIDICCPINVKTHKGMFYFITSINDISKYRCVINS